MYACDFCIAQILVDIIGVWVQVFQTIIYLLTDSHLYYQLTFSFVSHIEASNQCESNNSLVMSDYFLHLAIVHCG